MRRFVSAAAISTLAAFLCSVVLNLSMAENFALSVAAADPARGERVFRKCKACHMAEPDGRNLTGPNLWGIVGRSKAAVDGFRYSSALASLNGIWDYEELDAYLLAPREFLPRGRMTFRLRKAADRAAVIAFLRTRSESPFPLPTADDSRDSAVQLTAEDGGPADGLPPGEGREQVRSLCSGCHSLQIVVQQGLDAPRWDALMDRMVDEEGMTELDSETRRAIVDYLATHFGVVRK